MFQHIRIVFAASLTAMALAGTASALTAAEYPPSADTGQCFARVLSADTIETVTESVEVKAETTRQNIIPAKYERQRIDVMVKEATSSYQIIPAVYETITEEVMVEPAREILIQIPAQYETYTETVEVEPAKLVWKTGAGLYGRGAAGTGTAPAAGSEVATGEILCKVMQPAKTRTIRHTRQLTPPRTEKRIMPAVFRTVAKQVVRTPARYEEVPIPAQYASIPVDVMTAPSRTEVEIVPATYATVTRKVVTSKGGLEWAEVLCDTNTTQYKIAEIQGALRNEGYALAVDGAYGPQTQNAMERYQRMNGLAVGYMTVETVKALNVDPYACNSLDGCSGPIPQTTTVEAVQAALTEEGFYAAVDGIHGPQTQNAMERFQKANGLNVGYLSAETMTALRITARI